VEKLNYFIENNKEEKKKIQGTCNLMMPAVRKKNFLFNPLWQLCFSVPS